MRRLLVAAAAILTACGSATLAPGTLTGSRSTPSAAATPTLTPGPLVKLNLTSTPPPLRVDVSRPIHIINPCGDWARGGPPSLQQYLSMISPNDPVYRMAAVVTINALARPAIYNTPDGGRWSQQWIDAGNGAAIYTPYDFTVNRPLTGGLTAGERITGYAEGGSVGADQAEANCTGSPSIPGFAPGAQAVVVFGGSMTSSNRGPVVTVFAVIQSGQAKTLRGWEPVP